MTLNLTPRAVPQSNLFIGAVPRVLRWPCPLLAMRDALAFVCTRHMKIFVNKYELFEDVFHLKFKKSTL